MLVLLLLFLNAAPPAAEGDVGGLGARNEGAALRAAIAADGLGVNAREPGCGVSIDADP